ncbi:MAG TPA: DUF6807 family protein [Planctomycetota bacterium]|nr:DUF6807 family protein [Planctomycetota bacterium]
MVVRKLVLVLVAWAVLALPARAVEVTLEVEAGDSDRVETPVCAPIMLPAAPGPDVAVEVEGPGGKVPGQLVPGAGKGSTMLCWLVSLKKGEKATYKAKIEKGEPPDKGFAFEDTKGDHLDLLFGGRKVTRFMYVFNPDPKLRFPTAKPFTHVFDAKGETIITSPGGDPYPHHRGIYIGWNKTKLPDGKSYDFWHVRAVWQRVEKPIATLAGPVLGRMTAEVNWECPDGKPAIVEDRTITVYRQSKPELLLDFVSTLHSKAGGDIELGGDPEHAGCQFRASPEVAKNQGETKYVFPPDGKEGTKGTLDMPWTSMSCKVGEARFNVAHLNHPDNPKGTVYSANRKYGRFGAFPKAVVKADQPLTFRYRFYVREAPELLTVEDVQRLSDDFTRPPKVTVKQ